MMKTKLKRAALLALLLGVTLPVALYQGLASDDASSLANADAVCPPDKPDMSRFRYLRSLSLDLTGALPTMEDFQAVDGLPDVPLETVQSYLNSDGFTSRAVEQHRDLLWNNVTNLKPFADDASINGNSAGGYFRNNLAGKYRGMRGIGCLNQPLTYNPDGTIQTFPQEDGTRMEGYVMVSPYWAPDTSIKVCGFDAQTTAVTKNGTKCNTSAAYGDTGCGCGPNLKWCANDTVRKEIMTAFTKDVDLRLAEVFSQDRSYLELFTGKTAWVNGPIVFYLKNLIDLPGNVRLSPSPIPLEYLPDLAYTDKDKWVEVALGAEHAGILTSPAFLTRFMSNRARANRFYSNFLCEPFQPPEGGIVIDQSDITLDLQERNGCNGCHQVLEPAASYWGRWTENGAGFLPASDFAPISQECQTCLSKGGCSSDCQKFYVYKALAEEENPWIGAMRWYEFRHEEHYEHIEEGPALLASRSVADNRLPLCVARNTATWLLGREPLDAEEDWLQELSKDFAGSGYNYRALVQEIVTSPVYRRVQ